MMLQVWQKRVGSGSSLRVQGERRQHKRVDFHLSLAPATLLRRTSQHRAQSVHLGRSQH